MPKRSSTPWPRHDGSDNLPGFAPFVPADPAIGEPLSAEVESRGAGIGGATLLAWLIGAGAGALTYLALGLIRAAIPASTISLGVAQLGALAVATAGAALSFVIVLGWLTTRAPTVLRFVGSQGVMQVVRRGARQTAVVLTYAEVARIDVYGRARVEDGARVHDVLFRFVSQDGSERLRVRGRSSGSSGSMAGSSGHRFGRRARAEHRGRRPTLPMRSPSRGPVRVAS